MNPLHTPGTARSSIAPAPAARGGGPDFGPNVHVFSPGDTGTQEKIDAVFKAHESARFSDQRVALLFKPGAYTLDVPVGFYTQVSGLGRNPGDVHVTGAVRATAAWMNFNATCNFWRIAENLRVSPPSEKPVNLWSVSQAAPMRRMHIEGDLKLMEEGWASGGFLAQCLVEGDVLAGTQQQYFARNCTWASWRGGAWNIVLAGNDNPPSGDWPARPFTVVPHTPVIREKPFLFIDSAGAYNVLVPALRAEPTRGVRWALPDDRILPLDAFHIVRADRDTAASINAALAAGRHLLVTPGIYRLDAPLVVTRPGTVILGLGLPTFTPTAGNPCLLVEAGEGVVLAGLLFDAGQPASDILVQIGRPGRRAGRSENPSSLHDVFMRVGGPASGSVGTLLEIHDDHVIGDNLWLWRADHGPHVGWDLNRAATGLLVTGRHVTCYGLAAEHTQGHQVVWNGEDGRVFFFQSELPYDPPSQAAWMDGATLGYAAYKVGPRVLRHEACGLGVYHVFKAAPVVAARAFEAPSGPGILLSRLFTVQLHGGRPGSDIACILNDHPGIPHTQVAIIRTLDRPPPSAS